MPSTLKIDSCYDLHSSRGSSLDKSESSAESSARSSAASNNSAESSAKSSAKNVKISDKVEEELSQLWDSGQEWILIFDNLLKHPGGKVGKGCKCDMCEMQRPTSRCYTTSTSSSNEMAFEALENSGKKETRSRQLF